MRRARQDEQAVISAVAAELLGDGIRLYRQLVKPPLSQDQLARACGFSQSKVSRIEKGRSPLLLSELLAIAATLGVPVRWLAELPLLLDDAVSEEGTTASDSGERAWPSGPEERRKLSKALAERSFAPRDGAQVLTLIDGVRRPVPHSTRTSLSPRNVLRRAGVLVMEGALK